MGINHINTIGNYVSCVMKVFGSKHVNYREPNCDSLTTLGEAEKSGKNG